jgi:hypothetical protein
MTKLRGFGQQDVRGGSMGIGGGVRPGLLKGLVAIWNKSKRRCGGFVGIPIF